MKSVSVLIVLASISQFVYCANLRIIGGKTAAPGQFPYQVSVQTNRFHLCGGVLIHQRWVLTASACVFGYDITTLDVLVGSNTLSEGSQIYDIEKILFYAALAELKSPYGYDIGIMKTTTDITLSNLVQTIPISTQPIPEGAAVTFSGWGITSTSGNISDDLLYIDSKTISLKECQDALVPDPVTDKQFCTVSEQIGGVCRGDIGGPLVYNNQLIGLAAWYTSCAERKPDFFLNITLCSDWINDRIINN